MKAREKREKRGWKERRFRKKSGKKWTLRKLTSQQIKKTER